MRTTVDLPSRVFRAAKARAAERGESLKALLIRAVERELRQSEQSRSAEWPLIRSAEKDQRHLTSEDLEDMSSNDDVERHRRLATK
jgi:hypothetical protein